MTTVEQVPASPVDQALADILIQVSDTAVKAKDFVLAELPDVVQQLLMWKMIESLIWFGLGLLILSIIVFWWPWMLRQRWSYEYNNPERDRDGEVIGGSIAGSCILAITGSSFLFANLEWLQILVAPKVYLIEYASALIR